MTTIDGQEAIPNNLTRGGSNGTQTPQEAWGLTMCSSGIGDHLPRYLHLRRIQRTWGDSSCLLHRCWWPLAKYLHLRRIHKKVGRFMLPLTEGRSVKRPAPTSSSWNSTSVLASLPVSSSLVMSVLQCLWIFFWFSLTIASGKRVLASQSSSSEPREKRRKE